MFKPDHGNLFEQSSRHEQVADFFKKLHQVGNQFDFLPVESLHQPNVSTYFSSRVKSSQQAGWLAMVDGENRDLGVGLPPLAGNV